VTRSYSVTVTNRDGADCGSSTFALTSSLPAGWSGGLVTTTLTLAPGVSGTATLNVTNPANTGAGSYAVTAGTVADAVHTAASVNGTFWIDTSAPSAPSNLRASVKGTKVTLSWTAAGDTGGSGLARYEIQRNAAPVGTSASTTYAESPGSGTYTYTVFSIDGAGNRSTSGASVSVTVGSKTPRR
jgi:chitinase